MVEGYVADPARPTFRPDIQGLRALAVLLVIGNHARIIGFGAGFIGVDVFFVISGYVITQLVLREAGRGVRIGLEDFYSRRIRRIVPAATATLVGTLIVAALLLHSKIDPHLPGDVRWASLFATNFRLIATGSNYFVPGIQPSLITQFWSLAVEEQFYLAFPLVVFLIARHVAPAWRIRTLQMTLTGAIVLSAWWSIHVSAQEPTLAYYSPFTRFWELGLGCFLATLSLGRPIRTVRAERLAVVIGLLLLLIALTTIDAHSVYPGIKAWLPCAATALLLWAGASGPRTPVTRFLSNRPMGYIGDLSYSLYLTHYVWLQLPGRLGHPLTGWAWRLPELIGITLTAMCSYHLLENPIRRSRRLAGDRVAIGLLLGVCIAGAWAVSLIVARAAHVG